jgi:hypothetical protein
LLSLDGVAVHLTLGWRKYYMVDVILSVEDIQKLVTELSSFAAKS